MRLPKTFAFIFLVFDIFSQPPNDNCINATVLCANQIQLFSNANATIDTCAGCSDGVSSAGNFCFELNNTVWFSFTTNSDGGTLIATFSNIVCNGDTFATASNELQAIIIEASIPCDESSYTEVSNCESGSSSNFTLLANNLAPNTTYYIQVDGGESGSGITDPAECGFSIVLSGEAIESSVNAGEDQYVFPGESVILNGTSEGTVNWTPSTSLSNASITTPTATPSATTTYTITSNENNCIYTDEVTVYVQPNISIPNTITPNEDGYNDTWSISNIHNYPGAQVSVYDRWGQRVFYVTGYTAAKEWDGTNNGLRLPSATYYYVIELRTSGVSKLYNGAITIIR